MSELSSLFGIISEGQKQAAQEKAEKERIEEDRKQRLEPQIDVGLNDLSEFFSVMSTKKKVDVSPKETKQEVQQLEVLSSFFEQMSNFENSLDSAIETSKKEPEVIEKIANLKKVKDDMKLNFDIEVDGGVNFDNNQMIIEAGANILVSGTTIFKENNGDVKKNIDLLKIK